MKHWNLMPIFMMADARKHGPQLSLSGFPNPGSPFPKLVLSDLARDPAHWRKTEHGAAVRAAAA